MKLVTLAVITALFVVVAVSAESQEVQGGKNEKLKVAVYYETLCGDSKRFIRSQLYPVKKSSLGENFEIELIPYGKATTSKKGSNSFEFDCQHGELECEGNKMHACALAPRGEAGEGGKYINSTELQLDFIYCSMSAKSPPHTLTECAKKLNIDETEIRQCAEGLEGSQLLAINGEKTHGLKPKLYFVPWITFNGAFTSEKLQSSQYDFKSVICSELKINGVSPTECEPTSETWGARRA